MNRKRLSVMLIMLTISVLVLMSRQDLPQQTKTAYFVLSGWSYPDEYGQGIDSVGVYENSTGSWLPVETIDYDEDHIIQEDLVAGGAIKLVVWTWQNSTLTQASDWEDGKNYHRHNVTMSFGNGTVIFSQQNFTYAYCFPAINPPLWCYGYEVILNHLLLEFHIYYIEITYEVFYGALY